MIVNFADAAKYVLENEGSKFVNIPQDRGGACKYGITQEALSQYRGRPVTVDDIKNLNEGEASMVVFSNFWVPLGLSEVKKPSIATAILDMAFNLGMFRAVKFAQIALCACGDPVEPDGHIGEKGGPSKTKSALDKCEEKVFLFHYSNLIKDFYKNIIERDPSQRIFIVGWVARAERLKTLTNQEPS